MVFSKSVTIAVSCATSVGTASTRSAPTRAAMRSRVAASSPIVRLASTTRAPSAASRAAVAAPMPRPPPVTMATLSFRPGLIGDSVGENDLADLADGSLQQVLEPERGVELGLLAEMEPFLREADRLF